MIVSSKVDLACWTGRVGLVCRDGREALTTGEAGQRREDLARREAGEVLTDIALTYNVSHSTISRL
jgi:hypothetical protein